MNVATVVTEREKFEQPSTDASVAVSSGCGLSCLITRQRAWFSMSGGPTDGPRSRRAIANGVVALKREGGVVRDGRPLVRAGVGCLQ